MKHIIHHNSTTFMLYCMNICVYLAILLADSNNIHRISNSKTSPKLNTIHN
jgi:hypothetical protein